MKEIINEEVKYYVFTNSFKNTLCGGFNSKQAKEVLYSVGWLDNKETEVKKINNKTTRVYQFNAKLFESE